MKLLTTHYSLQTKAGFTLLELLIVIGIITILVTTGIVSYTTAQQKSRDARRKTDLKSIQSAFEQYYSINDSRYPVTSAGALSGDLTSNSVILLTYPQDPTGGFYLCTTSCSVSVYSVCANLEAETSDYCIRNQQ